MSLYEQVIGRDPAPAYRRTWIVMRADPQRAQASARRRDEGVAGIARYLVASTTRIADRLASHGVDTECACSFDDFDQATEISFVREKWSKIKGQDNFTAAYIAPGGPDVWWSAPADHTITRVRITPGSAPRSTVLLTTATKPKRPRGFSRVSGGQRAALQGQTVVSGRHWQLPIGSAGVLVGETASKYPVYMPFDDVDASINLGDARAFMQFAVRAAPAGGTVTLAAHFQQFADLIGAEVGPESKVAWPHARSRPDDVHATVGYRLGDTVKAVQLFVVGPPRSGLTIVTQFLNHHEDIEIFDEIDLIEIDRSGGPVVGTLAAFLLERGVYDTYRRCARETAEPAAALRSVMTEIARPCAIWGEKNPRYATRLGSLRRCFPEAVVLFVLRDPRAVVNSCVLHRDSDIRTDLDFWIKDTVAEALALVESCLEPLNADDAELVVLRYEAFAQRPTATLDSALRRWGLSFSDDAVAVTHRAPETVGDNQFYRRGAPLPTKVGNLSPLRRAPAPVTRIDADDPAWSVVDALAARFGYN